MSELKAYIAPTPDGTGLADYYLKSEADKVIAELKAQKAQAEDDCAYWKMSEGNAVNAMHETEEYAVQLYKELRHHKYKRCLAMARWCETNVYNIRRKPLCDMDDHEGWQHDDEFWQRWHKRWLELAEKFKEGK